MTESEVVGSESRFFYEWEYISIVTIPDSLTSIVDRASYDCESPSFVTVP